MLLKKMLANRLYAIGVLLLIISLGVFSIPLATTGDEAYVPIFMACMICAIAYFFIRRYSEERKGPHGTDYVLINLLLFLVSAYALNRNMEVFSATPPWMCVLLLSIGLNFIVAFYFESLPSWLRTVVLLIAGVSALLFFYLAFYLMPLYAISVPALLFFGVSIHTYIPALLLYYTFRKVAQVSRRNLHRWLPFTAGIVLAFGVCLVHAISWNSRVQTLNGIYSAALTEGSEDLPAWMQVAQGMRTDAMNERVLKSGLVYDTHMWKDGAFFSMPERSLGELARLHDPLVLVSSLLAPPLRIPEEERIRLLKTQFGARHHTEERLWTGKDLSTEHVQTQVRLWPQYRIAYTEQLITVANGAAVGWRGRQEEAIYTFHLPQGSVVTSLSLWINGQEAKGVLTTKEKADSAYHQVVGVEQHDPSVVHWQEGSRVSVRVFPVLARDRRIFKVGFTSPLAVEGGELVYRNAPFEGPDASGATEKVQLKLDGGQVNEEGRQVAFRSTPDAYAYEGSFRQGWEYRTPQKPLSTASFGWKGKRYSVAPLQAADTSVEIRALYLDADISWSAAEWDAAWKGAAGRPVYVDVDGLIRLNEGNRGDLFRELKRRRFGMFPVFRIKDPAHALLVTKGGGVSPNLEDLKGSPFFEKLKTFSKGGQPVLLLHLGRDLTDYLAALRDFRCVRYQQGDLGTLNAGLKSGRFRLDSENDNSVALQAARLQLQRSPGNGDAGAPDHLLRLFAFNHLLRQYGSGGIDNGSVDSTLVAEAREANIVSPVSSLVVLETAADYERFGIDASVKGLQNATLRGSGAVPEPHEWLLIIITAGIAFVLFIRMRAGI
jgi:XrtN system VIT domain protein